MNENAFLLCLISICRSVVRQGQTNSKERVFYLRDYFEEFDEFLRILSTESAYCYGF